MHPFNKTLGPGPYKLIAVWSMPSPSLLEQNPDAFNNAMRHAPKLDGYIGSCSGILHHYIIQNSNGKTYAVGSTCVNKHSQDPNLIKEVKRKETLRQKQLKQSQKNERQKLAEKLLEVNKEKLTKQPHPNQYYASQGKTLYEYYRFCLGSDTSNKRIIKDLKDRS